MKTMVFALPLTISLLAQANAGAVFDGYESYYLSKDGAIFKESDERSLQPFSVTFDDISGKTNDEITVEKNVFAWRGVVDGKKYSFSLIDRSIYESDDEGPKESFVLNGKKFYFKKAKIFPGVIVGEIRGHATSLYINKSYLCLEGEGLGSSGTSQRHRDVYLLPLAAKKDGKQNLYKLPSLFASCHAIRRDKSGKLVFPKITYRYIENTDAPVGVTFQDYTFKAGQFVPLGPEIQADFVEPENMYKFKVR